MADQVELEVTPREVMGKATKKLRKAGLIPANISGHNETPIAVQIDAISFERLRRAHKATSILRLKMPNATTQTALIRHVQHSPKSNKILHIDFSRVSLDERIAIKVPLNYVGEAPGVKIEGGVLLHLLEALDVECRASDLISSVDVDISSLAEIDSTLHAGDVKLPANFTLVTDPAEPIAKVASTAAEVAEANAPAVESEEGAAETPEATTATPAES